MPHEGISGYRPLTLSRFGIELHRMTEEEKEMVRAGRNKDFVRNNHVYRKIISVEEHEAWFREVSSPLHYIMVIHFKNRDIGAVIVKDFQPDLSTTTCGAFLWDEDFVGTKVPILSILIALDFFFHNVGISSTQSVVLKSNSASINMNRFFGFTFSERDEESFHIYMDKASYFANRERLNTFAFRAAKNQEDQQLKIAGSRSSINLSEINALLQS